MAMKQSRHIIKGMQRDLSVSKFNPEFAYENMNIRLTARENNTFMSVTNEKGTKEIRPITSVDGKIPNKITVTTISQNENSTDISISLDSIADVNVIISYKYDKEGYNGTTTIYKGSKSTGRSYTNELGSFHITAVSYDDKSIYKYYYSDEDYSTRISGIPLGSCVIGNYITLFTKSTTGVDYIYRLQILDDVILTDVLFQGDLNFNFEYPIQTLASYENENIQKVYWVDGINQARVVNIINRDYTSREQFNFLRQISNSETIKISKIYGVGGFHSGVIQYAISYYITNGQESAIVYSSPLYYITPEDRGGSPEELCSCAFKIQVANADLSFDGINIYSIHRTSLDAAPSVRLVSQMPIKDGQDIVVDRNNSFTVDYVHTVFQDSNAIKVYKDNKIHDLTEYEYTVNSNGEKVYKFTFEPQEGIIIIDSLDGGVSFLYHDTRVQLSMSDREAKIEPLDSNLMTVYKAFMSSTEFIEITDVGTGSTVDPSELLYKGGEEIVPYTIAQKDNTLFLGNLTIKRSSIPEDVRKDISNIHITTKNRSDSVQVNDFNEKYYPYKGYYNMNSSTSTTFKYGEEYRLGFVFLHNTGKWSEAIPAKDITMDIPILISDDNSYSFTEFSAKLNYNTFKKLKDLGYIAVKPVVVFPSIEERNILAQGIVCPTVYDSTERNDKSVFARSSWFVRPKVVASNDNFGAFERGGIVNYRQGDSINNVKYTNAEVQTLSNLRVDENVFTFHSPEVEFSEIGSLLSNCKMKIVGYALCTSNVSDYSITATDRFRTNTTGSFPYRTPHYSYTIPWRADGKSANLRVIALPVWQDGVFATTEENNSEPDNESHAAAVFPVYPWHRDTSLNNDIRGDGSTSKLERKVFSTLIYTDTKFFAPSNVYEFEKPKDTYRTGIADLQLFNSNELSATLLNPPKNSSESEPAIYFGNTDKMVYSENGYAYTLYYVSATWADPPTLEWANDRDYIKSYTGLKNVPSQTRRPFYRNRTTDPTHIKYKSTPHVVGRLNNSLIGSVMCLPQVSPADDIPNNNNLIDLKYPTEIINIVSVSSSLPSSPIANGYYMVGSASYSNYVGKIYQYRDGEYVLLSSAEDTELSLSAYTKYTIGGSGSYRLAKKYGEVNVSLMSIDSNSASGIKHYVKDDISNLFSVLPSGTLGVLLMTELYRDNAGIKFGGTTDSAYSNNIWIPAGKTVKFDEDSSQLEVQFTDGDTFFQRYDHLKTYPFDSNSKNNLVEIVSFMCETRINIDGRYDRNRGKQNNLSVTPQNFNLFNPVYSQKNNFFTYIYQDLNTTRTNAFPNTVTWTKEKINGASVDAWTNITMASTLAMDGDKGSVVSLNTFNNEIYCFQEQGLSNIIFNPRVQIPASDNLPIEISNSYKVQGKRYLSNIIGCTNKWSICETPKGIYFIDNLTNALYLFNGQGLSALSDELGFRKFIGDNNSLEVWNPKDFRNFRTFYDKTNDDVYFVNRGQCLTYSELIGQFTSFMSYEETPLMLNYKDKFFAFKNYKVWEMNAGDYNMFFGEFQPYYVTIVANQDEPIDKIFNTIEYRADVKRNGKLMPDETFTKLTVWNEYQRGTLDLTNRVGHPSPIKRKFRIWRANVPRDNNSRNRIRNTWAYVSLIMDKESTDSMELHDINVSFFE